MPAAIALVPTDEDILDAKYIYLDHLLRMLEARADAYAQGALVNDDPILRYLSVGHADEAREIARLLRDGLVER